MHYVCVLSLGRNVAQTYEKQTEFILALITSVPYGSLEMTSGAIQYGVPTKDFRLGTSFETWAQKPKSESFI